METSDQCPRAVIPVLVAIDINSISLVYMIVDHMIVIEKQKGGQAGYKHLLVVTEALRHLVSWLSTMLLLLELYMWQCTTMQTTHCFYEFEKAFMVERFLGNFATMH